MTVKGSDFPKLQNCLSHIVAIALITIITTPTNLFTTMNTALAVLNFFFIHVLVITKKTLSCVPTRAECLTSNVAACSVDQEES